MAENDQEPRHGPLSPNEWYIVVIDAIHHGLLDKFQQALEVGYDVDTRIGDANQTALMLAAWASIDIVEILLKHNASVDAVDRDGDSALLYTCRTDAAFCDTQETLQIVAKLVHAGANPFLKNRAGDDAFAVLRRQTIKPPANEVRIRLSTLVRALGR